MIAVVMRTMDRTPGPNYLGQTLKGFKASGVFSDPRLARFLLVASAPTPREFWRQQVGPLRRHPCMQIDEPTARRTPNGNAAHALSVGSDLPWEWLLMCEDDISPCADLIGSVTRWLARHADPAVPLYTFGSNYRTVHAAARAGSDVADVPRLKFFGTTCYAIRAHDARSLSAFLAANPTYRGRTSSQDLLARFWVAAAYPGCEVIKASAPSFVQHIGRQSSIRPDDRRRFIYPWGGPRWSYAA